MPKQLINVIGVVIAVGIVLLAIVLGVVPQLTAAGTTNAQADQVATTNVGYQLRINQLQRQKQNLPAIQAAVAQLHRQIPAEYRLDDAFLLVAQAAETSKATIVSVTAGVPTAFAERSAPVPAGQPTPAPTATPAPTSTPASSPMPAAPTGSTAASAGEGRTQIPIAIDVTVPNAAAASQFLDGLRAGPRLLANVTSTATGSTTGVDLQVSVLAFAEPSTATVAKGGN